MFFSQLELRVINIGLYASNLMYFGLHINKTASVCQNSWKSVLMFGVDGHWKRKLHMNMTGVLSKKDLNKQSIKTTLHGTNLLTECFM